MNRTKFYNIVTNDGVAEYDFLDNTLSNFKLTKTPIYYMVNEADAMRPDMISFEMYNTVNYWWIICMVNGIMNPFTDIKVGKVLIIPSIFDIYTYVKDNAKR